VTRSGLSQSLIAVLFVGAVFAAGCKQQSSDAVVVIPKGTTHEFWKSVHAGAEKAGQELGIKVIWKGPLREDDREEQIKVVENFVTMKVKGIALAPLDSTALVPVVSDAARAGVPVVIFDSDLKTDQKLSYVATDNYKGGTLAGQHVGELLGGKGDIAVLRYAEGSESTQQREQGFLDAVAKFPGIRVVSSNQYGGATMESAFKASENLLAAYKSGGGLALQAIFTPNESTTFGMLRALEDSGLGGKVHLVGFDSSPKLIEWMRKGFLDATVVQDPMQMGYLSVKALYAHLHQQPVEKRIDTGATLITKANMDEPRSKELLSPDIKKWLKE